MEGAWRMGVKRSWCWTINWPNLGCLNANYGFDQLSLWIHFLSSLTFRFLCFDDPKSLYNNTNGLPCPWLFAIPPRPPFVRMHTLVRLKYRLIVPWRHSRIARGRMTISHCDHFRKRCGRLKSVFNTTKLNRRQTQFRNKIST